MKKIRKFALLTCIEKSVYTDLVNKFNKGFTLIELLVVIAVLGVLAAGVFTAINPLKRIQQAKDATLKNDVGQVVQAAQAYFTQNQKYPADTGTFTTSKELKTFPTTVSYAVNSDGTAAAVYGQSNEDTAKYFCWDSTISTVKYTTTTVPTATAPTCN